MSADTEMLNLTTSGLMGLKKIIIFYITELWQVMSDVGLALHVKILQIFILIIQKQIFFEPINTF